MPNLNARRALYGAGFCILILAAILAVRPGVEPSTMQGAAPTGDAPSPAPDWQQLMGRSVQARKAGAIHEAQQLLQQAVNLAATFGPHDMRRAHTRSGLAEFHLWSGQPELAELEYKEAVSIGEATGGANHPEMISLLEGLANFYYYRERYDEVLPIQSRILEIVRGTTPRDPHEEARRLRNIGQVYQLKGRHADAESQYIQALRLVEASPNGAPGELAEYLQAAAECYRASGKSKTASPLAARALELMENLAGPETLDVVPYLKTLADVSLETGQPQRAAGLYQRAFNIVEQVSGAGHSDLEPYALGLATAQKAQEKLRKGEPRPASAPTDSSTRQKPSPGERT